MRFTQLIVLGVASIGAVNAAPAQAPEKRDPAPQSEYGGTWSLYPRSLSSY